MLDELLIPASFVLAIDQESKNLVLARFGQAKPSQSPVGWKQRLRPPLLNTTIALGLIHDRRTLLVVLAFASPGAIALIFHAPV
jgi:lipoprotein signal peptidase